MQTLEYATSAQFIQRLSYHFNVMANNVLTVLKKESQSEILLPPLLIDLAFCPCKRKSTQL